MTQFEPDLPEVNAAASAMLNAVPAGEQAVLPSPAAITAALGHDPTGVLP